MQPTYILQPLSNTAASVAEIQVPNVGPINIGRDTSNDFSVPNDSKMSSVHFELSAEAGGCRARDLGSSNGLFLNTKRIAVALLVEGDEIQAGESRWRVAVRGGQSAPYTAETPLDQSRGYAPAVAAAPTRSPIVDSGGAPSELQLTSDRGVVRLVSPSEALTIGRTALANWVFDHDGQMSSIHLEVFRQAGAWRVKDLASSNGTFLNESRISESRIRTGDEIRGGQTRFVVELRPSQTPSPQAINAADSLTSRSAPPSSPPSSLPSSLPSTLPPTVPTPPVHPAAVGRPLHPPPVGPAPISPLENVEHAGNQQQKTALLRRVSDGRQYNLLPGKIVELGRGLDLDISLPEDLEVSTQHATVVFDGQYVQLQDTGSSNGTFVGEQRVTSYQLADGERFRVGQTLLQVGLSSTRQSTERREPKVRQPAPLDASPVASQWQSRESVSGNRSPRAEYRDAPIIPVRKIGNSTSGSRPQREARDTPSPAEPPQADGPPIEFQHDSESRATNDQHDSESRATKAELSHDALHDPSPDRSDHQQPGVQRHMPSSLSEPTEESAEVSAGAAQEPKQPTESEPASIPESPATSPANDLFEAAEVIDWESPNSYAASASEIEGVVCRSGLIVYRGQSSGWDPVDVGLRVLQITSGWVLNGSEIENWMEAARQGLSGLPREWLNPAKSDDASWMLPFLSNWGSGKSWLVFASVELDDALQNILSLRPTSEDAPPLMPALTPQALATFLAEHDRRAVERFFQPFDAIMVEVRAGERWALFSRRDLQAALRQ